MANQGEFARGLEQAAQKHEREIVIEFGSDRILHYIGVYLLTFLALVAKVSELASENLSCYPAGNTPARSDFIKHATSYCWESVIITSTQSSINRSDCGSDAFSEGNLLKDPSFFKRFIQWMPYAVMLEALLFALPSVWWHYRVGARLMGHMKFMQLLLNNIYEAVKPIPTGIYNKGEAYDSESYYLNGWRGFEPRYQTRARYRFNNQPDANQGSSGDSSSLVQCADEENEDGQSGTTRNLSLIKERMARFFYGDIRDRHLFSMLCFENFSSLEHHPYILSVYKLSQAATGDPEAADTLPKTQAILRLLRNKNNFSGRFLVTSYLLKHIFGATVSMLVLVATVALLLSIGQDGWDLDSFSGSSYAEVETERHATTSRKFQTAAV